MLDGKTFHGLKVLDSGKGGSLHCAMMLAQHGASVTKVEPHEGDWVGSLEALVILLPRP